VPGPGNYAAKNYTGKDSASFSMGATNKYFPVVKEQNFKPGPGNYSPTNKAVKKAEPSYGIGTGTRKDLAFEKAQTFQTSPG